MEHKPDVVNPGIPKHTSGRWHQKKEPGVILTQPSGCWAPTTQSNPIKGTACTPIKRPLRGRRSDYRKLINLTICDVAMTIWQTRKSNCETIFYSYDLWDSGFHFRSFRYSSQDSGGRDLPALRNEFFSECKICTMKLQLAFPIHEARWFSTRLKAGLLSLCVYDTRQEMAEVQERQKHLIPGAKSSTNA